MKMLINGKHYQVDMVVDGEAALEKIRKRDYDLVLCDYKMPKMNGVMLREEIEKLKPEIAKRFLFITGCMDIKDADPSTTPDRSYLFKPFTRAEFMNAVNSVYAKSA